AGKNISDSGTGLAFQRINVLRSLFLLDTIKPSLTVNSPLNQTYNTTNISLSYSAFDNVSLDSCAFTNTTGSSLALSGCSNITFAAIANQQNNINVSANDSNGNANSSQVFFFVDTVLPLLTVFEPRNVTYQTNNISLNLSASDSNKIDRCWFVNTTGSTVFINSPKESCSNATFLGISGLNNITAYANDTGGNLNSSQVFFTVNLSFILDVQQPTNSTYTSANISVNYTISGFDSCWLVLNDVRTNMSGCTNITVTAAQNQLNNITIFTNNSNGDTNSTQIFFTIDTLSPAVNFSAATPNNETLNTNDVIINITLSEPASSVLLEWNGTNITMTGSLSRNQSFFDLADGNYSFRVYANDTHGNGNFTPFRWAFVNATRNVTSFIASLNSSLPSDTVLVLLNTTGEGDASRVIVKTNYTLRFNITGIIAEVVNFSWLTANTSNLINVTRNISIINISAAFNATGGILDNYVWVDINNFTQNYTPKISFVGAFRLNYYINGSREAPDSRRINETCNSAASNVPCYLISEGITTINLASFSGAAAGNDTQAPAVTIISPSGTQTDSNVSLLYSASDNVAVDRCWFSLNNGPNVTPAGCSNTSFVPASGSNTLAVYANDSSGNLNSSSVTFTYSPPAPASSGGSGGGGGSAIAAPQTSFRKTWGTPRGNSSVSIGSVPVKFVSIVATGISTLIISPEKTGPVELEYAYQYFSMNATNIKSAEISFAVNKTWIEFYELDKSKVRLSRFSNGWIPLATRLTGENSTHLTYLSEVPGFSYFVISGERIAQQAEREERICIQVITPATKGDECVEYPTPCDVPEGWTKVNECPAKEHEKNAPAEGSKPTQEIAFLLVSAIVVVLAVFAFHKSIRKKL
ncbi:MAG: PGF-pre-PGF domain-containing protein, partial [Candidatus Aenigmarchaeota archaeon]|nr:PGF-pre-PGF domain-containing protein [Candidatus Aenigmarchaeota archaeon]